jgi:hypothetical protein
MRSFVFAVVATATIAGVALGVAPAVIADPIDADFCTAWNADGSCYYANCSEAFAAPECDIPKGSPHYCAKQDRDGDGIACECPG